MRGQTYLLGQEALFAHCTDSFGTQLEPDLLPLNNERFGLQVRLPYLFSMALGKANVVAVLFTFAGDVTFLHGYYHFSLESGCYCSVIG